MSEPEAAAAQAAAAAAAAAAAVDGEALLRRTQQLVAIRSVVDAERGTSEMEAAMFLAGELRALGLEVKVEEVAPGRPNLIADWSGRGFDPERHRTLMFEGHTDVVTEGDARAWSRDPYGASLELEASGMTRLYGRGSADMKAGVCAAIAALEAIVRSAPDLPGRIRLGFVVDEEGMMLGIKDFIARGHADAVDGAIVCEPEENELCLFQKGAMRVAVHVQGVMAHGAMPYAGVNPIAALVRFLAKVAELEAAEQARLGVHPYLGRPHFTPTIVQAPVVGEAQLNVMPEGAYAALDIRTVPGQDHDALYRTLRSFADELEGDTPRLSIRLDFFESRPWTATDPSDPLVAALEAAYPDTIGGAPRYGGVPGATDGTFLHAAGVPIVTVGPGDRTIPHQVDEFVRVEEVLASAKLYASAAIRYFMASPPETGPRGRSRTAQPGRT